jgi:hypothetical protein
MYSVWFYELLAEQNSVLCFGFTTLAEQARTEEFIWQTGRYGIAQVNITNLQALVNHQRTGGSGTARAPPRPRARAGRALTKA